MGAGNTVRWIDDPELTSADERCRRWHRAMPPAERLHHGVSRGHDFLFRARRLYARMAHARIAGGGIRRQSESLWIAARKLRLVQPVRISAESAARRGAGRPGNDCQHADESQSSWHAEDTQVIQHYFQENFWLEHLARQEQEAIWQYPYDRPHCYLLTNLEAYLDLYPATGDPRYHDACWADGSSIATIGSKLAAASRSSNLRKIRRDRTI